MNILADLKSWWLQPYRADMSAAGWIALVGLLFLGLIFWGYVVGHVLKGLPSTDAA